MERALGLRRLAKRSLDLAFAVLALAVTLPCFPVIALVLWLDSRGPIFFRQQRVGMGGRLFTVYKFRTMRADARPYADSPSDDDGDPRITRIGRILRKSGLDELPQFFNVLRGDMSIVGPRPEMPLTVQLYDAHQRRRLAARPGLTGLWQISPVRNEPIHENLCWDLYYVRRQSFWLDLWIIAATLAVVLRGLGLPLPPPVVRRKRRVESRELRVESPVSATINVQLSTLDSRGHLIH